MQGAMFKVCLFGDGGVGKTTLINRYLTGVFQGGSEITIGVDFHIKRLDIKEKRITLQIWDFAGEERFRFLLPSYVLGASGGIFMFDITRYSSLRNFQDWLDIVRQGYKGPLDQIPIIMVGSKLDLEYKRAVSREEAFELARRNNLSGYIECSSKDGQNVNEVFFEIGRLMINKANKIKI
ncbi:MAG: Rab family GTPase [Candidatus Hermodarchaeota archaeon]